MKNSNPWYVPVNAPAQNVSEERVSSAPSQAFTLVGAPYNEDELADEFEVAILRLAAKLSNAANGEQALTVMVASATLLAGVLNVFPKPCRKDKLRDVIDFLTERTEQ